MRLANKARDVYHDGGTELLFKAVWLRLLRRNRARPYIESTLGERLHEQLVMAPFVGYWPRLDLPRTFNEKVACRKLSDVDSIYVIVADKYRVRDYVETKVGDEILTDLFAVTDDPTEISFDEFPQQFVVKGTHGSNMNRIIQDKTAIDIEELRSECNEWLSQTYGEKQKEHWYSKIHPQIIIEEFLEDSTHEVPLDYKFFVFNGEVEYIQVDRGRFDNHTRNFYTTDWELQPFGLKYLNGPTTEEPKPLTEMISVSEKLADDFDFARVDLYNPKDDEIFFGEITLAPGSGMERFKPKKYDFELGSYWEAEIGR